MILMVRMFMTMHREHVGSIRDEVDRVQQLTRELETLQVKLGESSNAEKGTGAAGVETQRRETKPRLSAQEANGRRSPGSALGSPNESRGSAKRPIPPGPPGLRRPRLYRQPTRRLGSRENLRRSIPCSFTPRSPDGSPSSSGNDKGIGGRFSMSCPFPRTSPLRPGFTLPDKWRTFRLSKAGVSKKTNTSVH